MILQAPRSHLTSIAELTCEHQGGSALVAEARPRFAWQLCQDFPGAKQVGFRVRVETEPERLVEGGASRLDSGVIMAREPWWRWQGEPLRSRERLWWTVDVQDSYGNWHTGPMAQLEAGLLAGEDWIADWVGAPGGWIGRALHFRCEFSLDGPVQAARLYVVGLGLHDLHCNGQRIGRQVLDPPFTDPAKRILTSVHDLTAQLRSGSNVFAAVVGHGWTGSPRLLAQLEVEDATGRRTIVATGRHWHLPRWKVRPGELLNDSIFDGEVVDARLRLTGFDHPDTNVSAIGSSERCEQWSDVYRVSDPGGKRRTADAEPCRVVAELPPIRLAPGPAGGWIADFGVNLAGWVRLRLRGAAGDRITIRYGEFLEPNGDLSQTNLYQARAADTYIAAGTDGGETYEPRFTYHGFRYARIDGLNRAPDAGDVIACRVRNDLAFRARFACGDELLARIHAMVLATEEANLVHVPTDCPQRAERMGWLNDLTGRAETLVLHFACARFLGKWLDDLIAAQDPVTGAVPDTVPFHWGYTTADPVCLAPAQVPWLLWRHFGDAAALERGYPLACGWARHLLSLCQVGILEYGLYGDWAQPIDQAEVGSIGSSAVSAKTPLPLVSTAHLYRLLILCARMAEVLGDTSGAHEWQVLAEQTRSAFRRRFIPHPQGMVGTGTQACEVIALQLGLLNPDEIAPAIERIAHSLAAEGGAPRLTTGNIATKHLLEALSDHGRHDLALSLTRRRTYPSWGHMLDRGATTLWERWEELTGAGMNSHNHPMLGMVAAWMVTRLVGVRDDESASPGTRFTIRPGFARGIGHATVDLPTINGPLHAGWHEDGDAFVLTVNIPPNASAIIHLPDREPTTVGPGNHTLRTVIRL